MTRSLDEQLNRIERVQDSLATNPSFEIQLGSLPPAVRSVAESLALRDMESAKRYVALFVSGNRGGKQ
jgi:hypothetical protein